MRDPGLWTVNGTIRGLAALATILVGATFTG